MSYYTDVHHMGKCIRDKPSDVVQGLFGLLRPPPPPECRRPSQGANSDDGADQFQIILWASQDIMRINL